MLARLLFVAGLVAGYVIGARTGRRGYDALMATARDAVRSPAARRFGRAATHAVEERVPKATAAAQGMGATIAGAVESARGADPTADGDADASGTPSAGQSSSGTSGEASPSSNADAPADGDPSDDPGSPPAGATDADAPAEAVSPHGDDPEPDTVVFSAGDFPAGGPSPEEIDALGSVENALEADASGAGDGAEPATGDTAPSTPGSPRGDTAPREPGSSRSRTRRTSAGPAVDTSDLGD